MTGSKEKATLLPGLKMYPRSRDTVASTQACEGACYALSPKWLSLFFHDSLLYSSDLYLSVTFLSFLSK
jgi:hypothetical protein